MNAANCLDKTQSSDESYLVFLEDIIETHVATHYGVVKCQILLFDHNLGGNKFKFIQRFETVGEK